MEGIHTEFYGVVEQVLNQNSKLSLAKCVAKAIFSVCKRLSDTNMMTFVENDVEARLHRLPKQVKAKYYHNDETYIQVLFEKSGSNSKGEMKLTVATVHVLIFTVSHKNQIEKLYPQVLKTLVHVICKELSA